MTEDTNPTTGADDVEGHSWRWNHHQEKPDADDVEAHGWRWSHHDERPDAAAEDADGHSSSIES